MMLSLLSVIVYLLLMCSSCDGQFCTTSPFQDPPKFEVSKHNAYCKSSEQNTSIRHSECNYSCSWQTKLKITSSVISSTLGIMEVMFTPFTLCNITAYEITLYVDETVTEDACSSVIYNNIRNHKHSSKHILVETCEPGGMSMSEEPCDENVTLNFNHVFSGCYLLDVELVVGGTSIRRRANGMLLQYITTYYKKNLDIGVQLNFSTQYYKDSASGVGELRCSIAYSVSYVSQLFYFWLIKNSADESVPSIYINGISFNTTGLTNESEIECDAKGLDDSTGSCKYLKGGVLDCVLHNVTPGYYTVQIQFVDDRCGIQSIWVNNYIDPCIWQLEFWANATDNSYSVGVSRQPVSESSHTTVFIVVISSVLLLSLLAFVAYGRLFAQYPPLFIPKNNRELKPLHVKEWPTLILLYARDCDQFMDVMEEFRSILKSSLRCMVFDYWDPVHYENVAQSPTDWVLRLISDKSVRIVLVTTPCSHLLEASLLTDRKVEYRKPNAFDKLFVFALKHLRDTTILDSYNRIFVVRLDKSAQNDNSSLTYFNPLAVYSLPTHLDQLMLGLHRVDAMEYVVSISHLPDIKHFSSSVESFQNFVHANPYYLDVLLGKADPDII